ncbi:MAG: sugar ABC transporter substrate-binding protein [Micrococcales bacterium]
MGARTFKKALVGVAAAALMLSTSVPAQAADNPTVAFSPMSNQIPALIGMFHGFQGFGASQGLNVIQAPDANFDPATQKKNLETLIKNGQIKGWWSLAAGAPSVLRSTLLLAQQRSVVAIVNGTPADYGFNGAQRGITFSAIDYATMGTKLGEGLGKCLVAKKTTTGEMILGANPAGTVGKKEMEAAFAAALKKIAPKVKIVQTVGVGGDTAKWQTSIRTAIQAHPKAIAFNGWSDEATLGALNAFKSANKTKNLCMVGGGGNDEVLAAQKAGTIWSVAKLDFEGDLVQSVLTLKAMVANPNAMGKLLSVPVKVFTK